MAIGPELGSTYCRCCRQGNVLVLTPSILSDLLYTIQNIEEREVFYVLVFGRGDSKDFRLKGYDMAARSLLSSANPSICVWLCTKWKRAAIKRDVA